MVARLSSKDLLVQSLYELMREQPYEQITVRAIAANCGLLQSPVKQRASPERTARLSGTNGV